MHTLPEFTTGSKVFEYVGDYVPIRTIIKEILPREKSPIWPIIFIVG
jgi:hypothetical protein